MPRRRFRKAKTPVSLEEYSIEGPSLQRPAAMASILPASAHVRPIIRQRFVIPPARIRRPLQCPFIFTHCFMRFYNVEEWIEHSFTHFRSIDPPPANYCCFCESSFHHASGKESWRERMHHVASHHRLGHLLEDARPDFLLAHYMQRNKLISAEEFGNFKENIKRRASAASSSLSHASSGGLLSPSNYSPPATVDQVFMQAGHRQSYRHKNVTVDEPSAIPSLGLPQPSNEFEALKRFCLLDLHNESINDENDVGDDNPGSDDENIMNEKPVANAEEDILDNKPIDDDEEVVNDNLLIDEEDLADENSFGDDKDLVDQTQNTSLIQDVVDTKDFMAQGSSYQSLSIESQLSLLPAALSSLTRIIMSIPNDRIWFSAQDDRSISNKVKALIEDCTEENWNWWPFQARMRVLQDNQTRVHWQCHCNRHLWTEILTSHAEIYQSILKRRNTVLRQNHLCKIRERRTSITTSLMGIFQAAGSASDPRRWYGSSASSSGTSSRQQTIHVTKDPQASNTRFSPRKSTSGNRQDTNTVINMPQINQLFVLFGVKGTRRTLELAQINTKKHTNDKTFFEDMRNEYRYLRGYLRYWFSVWRFSHCDFVKFEKIRANRIIRRANEIPTDILYEYKPKPPEAENPPISPHKFELAFASCDTSCLLSSFHDCVEPSDGTFAMDRIPKRKTALELKTGVVEFAWGIQAQHTISLLHMIIYHFLILAGTFGFWAWWQISHPNDIQTAAVPLTTVTVLLSLFWSSAGVLKILRDHRI